MESNKKNIEQIFKEQFQDFEVSPPDNLWDNISKEMEEKEESKKIIPLWFYGSGIAASLLLFFGLYMYINSEKLPVENQIVLDNVVEQENEKTIDYNYENGNHNQNKSIVLEEKSTEEQINTKQQLSTPKTNNKSIVINEIDNLSTIKTKHPTVKHKENNYPQNTVSENRIVPNNIIDSEKEIKSSYNNKNIITENNIIEKPLNEEQIDDAILAATLKGENDEITKKVPTEKRWSIQPQLGSFYYNSFAGSLIGENFAENPQFLESSFNYGARIAYQVTLKLKIRTGATFNSFKLTTTSIGVENNINSSVTDIFANNDINIVNVFTPDSSFSNDISDNSVEETTDEEALENIEEVVIENIEIEDPEVEGFNNGRESEELEDAPEVPALNTLEIGGITHQISYLEIPIEAAYNILDKKISIDLIGGMSTFILTNNDSYFQSNVSNTTTQLGENSALSQTSFTANFGVSTNYNFAKNWSFNLEPVMKIQFNSLNNSSNYSPFFIGLSSGLTWNF